MTDRNKPWCAAIASPSPARPSDDHLTDHYAGRTFTGDATEAVIPEESTAVMAPGQSTIRMTPVQTSSDVAAPGAPWEIQPETGDTFTVLNEWLDLDEQGHVAERVFQQGGALTFRDRMFTWVEMDAAAGQYVVGFVARDLDGNEQQAYTQVTVQ